MLLLWWVFFFSFSFLDGLALSILVWPPGVYQPAAVAVMFVCHHTWPGSAMCLVLDQTWLTDCCSCCLFPLTALSAPSTQLFCPPRSIPKLCQRMLHSTPPSVIGLLCWEPPDLIRKGIWTPLVLSCPHLSSGLLRSPSFPLTSPSMPLLTALILSSRLPSLAPRWLLSSRAKWLPCRFLRCRHFLALPFPSNVNPFLCDSCFFFCRAPPRKHLPLHSWWGWSSRGPTRPRRGRRGSALPLSLSVQTENCRSCLRWKVRNPPWEKEQSVVSLIAAHLHFPTASITHRAQRLPGVTPNNWYRKLHVWPIWMWRESY